MTRDQYARMKEIVVGALARHEVDQSAFVQDRCGSDVELRREVEALLPFVQQAAGLFEAPALSAAGLPLTTDALEAIGSVSVPFTEPLPASAFEPVLDEGFLGTERYVLRRRIGAGGMGIVYEVDDRVARQVVALKSIRRRHGADIYQLKREFRNLADVAHANLVTLHDLVVDDEQCFFTMELIEGETFADYVRGTRDRWPDHEPVRRALRQLIDGVGALHRRGLLHRDIKPSNVMVTPAGRVVVLDFGLTSGQLIDGPGRGMIVGTPAYLSPEQSAGAAASHASDWYGVGATLFHALTGRPPFDGPVSQMLARKIDEDPPLLSDLVHDAPDDLVAICQGLLRRDPVQRFSGADVLARLTRTDVGDEQQAPETSSPVFVGRREALAELDRALARVVRGHTACVLVHGPSGIGKTALVQRFVDGRVMPDGALLFRSRCHECEAIPYKALDGIVDDLTRHFGALLPVERARLLPAGAEALARLFPVMHALGIDASPLETAADPIRLRQQAFQAFRDLLDLLGDEHPVVLDIDDFHWADADSVRWIIDLLRPPAPRRLLVLVSFRSEELDAKPFLRALVERIDIGDRIRLPIGPLTETETESLVQAFLPAGWDAAGRKSEAIRTSGGNPFLAEALAQHAVLGAETVSGAGLREMLSRRLETLPRESRAFLEALAIAGRPEPPARVLAACGFGGDARALVARLRAAHLVRNSRTPGRVELYHDRIRESFAAAVSPEDARRLHQRLAADLVAQGDDDPEALFEHYRSAGHPDRAARYAGMAGEKASRVLAFDLAATFYRAALDLDPHAAAERTWRVSLARAVENAGRPVEAAETYLAAAAGAGVAEQIEWRRKAAELFLIGGQIDRGLAVSDDVLRRVGMRLARGPRTAVLSLALRRWQLRRRGLAFHSKPTSALTSEELLGIDACWSVSAGLAMVDPIRAADFNVKQLLRALEVGDPYRVARALALEAGFSVVGAGAGADRSAEFSRRASELSAHVGHQYVAALTELWAGIAAFLTGRWVRAAELCGRAATSLRDDCTGVIWELNLAQNFYLGGLLAQGEVRQVAGHLPGLVQAARERGNFYLEFELNTRMILASLAVGDVDAAEQRAADSFRRWSHRGFQRQHFNYLLARVQAALYRGKAREAWDLLEAHRTPLSRSLFLRVQHTRIEAANFRARAALAMVQAGLDVRRMCNMARTEAARIDREDVAWGRPLAALIRARVAAGRREHDQAAEALADAIRGFEAADMHLYAAVGRRRLGEMLGDARGREAMAAGDAWMAAQGIRDPEAMTRLIAP